MIIIPLPQKNLTMKRVVKDTVDLKFKNKNHSFALIAKKG